MGSYVVVTNADKVAVTGKKALQKMYYRHSHRPGSFKVESFKHLQKVRGLARFCPPRLCWLSFAPSSVSCSGRVHARLCWFL